MVSDTGCGMSTETIEKIFDPYYTTRESSGGSGLGMSMAYGIVKNHDGYITVYSVPDQGTTVHILFPLIETDIENITEIVDTAIEMGKNEHILLVDDEEHIIQMEKEMLTRMNYEVTARTSSIEALEAFKNQPEKFDLVITDLSMPNKTGIELAKDLLSIRKDTKILLCTGFSELITEKKAKAVGIKAFAMKPLLKREMAKIIRQVLEDRIEDKIKNQ
jgi:CheY-like chemotaxis protein